MHEKLLIVKTGTTFPAIRKNFGDFDDFIIRQAGIKTGNVIVSSVYKHESLPDLGDIAAIIITGSHAMVTEQTKWRINFSQWLRGIAHSFIPVLGICYGHQLLAQALGGQVDYHPKGKEIGTVSIELTAAGKKDTLMGVLPEKFFGHVTHAQTVITLPFNGRLLAKNNFEEHHAFTVNKNIWGVQFHPEFDAGVTRAYINEQKDSLEKEGHEMNKLLNSVQEHNYGKMLLQRFIELV